MCYNVLIRGNNMKILLVIDMQKGFMKNSKYLELNNKISDYISKSNYDKIIFTKYINEKLKNSLYQDKIGWTKLTTKHEQDFSLKIPKNAIIMEKYGYGLNRQDLDYINSLNIKEVDICGLKSEACVYAISLQLWDIGIYPNILYNYVEGDVDMKKIFIKQFGNITL